MDSDKATLPFSSLCPSSVSDTYTARVDTEQKVGWRDLNVIPPKHLRNVSENCGKKDVLDQHPCLYPAFYPMLSSHFQGELYFGKFYRSGCDLKSKDDNSIKHILRRVKLNFLKSS